MNTDVLLTARQMQEVDRRAVLQGLDSFSLMRCAGEAVADGVSKLRQAPAAVVVLMGPGNNGGDGAIAAAALRAQGYQTDVVRFGAAPNPASDAGRAQAEYGQSEHEVPVDASHLDADITALINAADIVIDALFGAGLTRALQGVFAQSVEQVNRSRAAVVAVDVPSGLNGNTHAVDGPCIEADVTVTFFRCKPVHYLYPGRALCGQLVLADIGLTTDQLEPDSVECALNQPAEFIASLPKLSVSMHKFQRGHVLVRSGPMHSTGASRLSAETALRSGAGLVTLASSSDALPINAAHLTAVMLVRADNLAHWQALLQDPRITTVVVGPGNGVTEFTRHCVLAALNANKTCVIDADALSCWTTIDEQNQIKASLRTCAAETVLTPHAGEFSRMFADLASSRFPSKLHLALEASRQTGSIVIFKGADTVIASPDGRSCINANAPAWLATAGAGDVLAGLVASLLAQGMPAFEAACAAVWLHGQAANTLAYPLCAESLVSQVGIELGLVSPVNQAVNQWVNGQVATE